jgi:hypothetical protein
MKSLISTYTKDCFNEKDPNLLDFQNKTIKFQKVTKFIKGCSILFYFHILFIAITKLGRKKKTFIRMDEELGISVIYFLGVGFCLFPTRKFPKFLVSQKENPRIG